MDMDLTILLSSAAVNVSLLVIVLVKQKDNLRNKINTAFIASVLLFLAWFAFNYLADSSTDAMRALLWTRLTVPSSLFALWFILWFSYAFPVKTRRYSRTLLVYFVLVSVLSTLAMTDQVFKSVKLDKNVGVSDMDLGIFYPIMIGLYLSLAGNMLYNFYEKQKRLAGIHRTQIRYILVGWSLFLLGGLLVSLIIPYLASNARWSKFGPLFSIVMVLFTTYAIIRHKFLDIRIVIQRGLIYTILLMIIAAVFLASIFSIGYVSKDADNLSDLLGAGITTLIGIFTIPLLEKYFRRVTDKIFFKDKYDYSEAMYSLSEILNRNLDLDELVYKLCGDLKRIFKTEDARIILPSGATLPDLFEEGTVVPILLEKETLGAIVLGRKLSGEPYSKEDVTLLRTFSYQAAVAIEKAKLYKKERDRSKSLEEKVKERTAELEKLQKAERQTMLDISHSLQTPLTVMKGELGALRKQTSSHEKIDLLENSIDKVSKFTYDLLKLARLELNEADSKKESIDLSGLVRDIIEYVDVIMREKQISLTIHIDPGISVLGQKDKLEELINNLISNSVAYSRSEDHNEISVALTKSGASAELTIEDTGVGIGEDDLPHVFERFYRVKRHDNIGAKGTGLGLAISKSIVMNHNGTIEIRSKLGVGTKFIVRLPIFGKS